MKIIMNRIFLVLMVVATIVYLTLMSMKLIEEPQITEAAEITEVVEVPVITEVPIVTEVPVIETLTAKKEFEVSLPTETPVAGFALLPEIKSLSLSTNNEDLSLLAKLIHCEAGIDSFAGKLAVGTVVMNRVKHYNKKLFGGPTIEGVIYHKLKDNRYHQFSCVDDESLWSEEPTKEDIKAAKKVLDGYRTFNNTYVYYYNPSICNGITGVVCDVNVGKHVFGHE